MMKARARLTQFWTDTQSACSVAIALVGLIIMLPVALVLWILHRLRR